MASSKTRASAAPASPAWLLFVALVVAPLVVLCIWLVTPRTLFNGGFDSDGVFYASMAGERFRGLGDRDVAPYCWRLLTPYLVSLSPLATLTSFTALALVSAWLNLVLCFALLVRTGLARTSALLGVVLFAGTFWTIKFSVYSPAYVDHQTLTFALGILLAATSRRFWLVPPLLLVGVVQKEALLALAPVVWVMFAERNGYVSRRSLVYGSFGLVLPPLALLVWIRTVLVPVDYDAWSVVASQARLALDPASWPRQVQALFSGVGILALLCLVRPRACARVLRREPQWLLMIVLGLALLLGGDDKARLYLFMLPALLVVALHVVEDWRVERGRAFRVWLGLTLALHLYLGHQLTPLDDFDEYLATMVPMHAQGESYRGPLVRSLVLGAVWVASTLAVGRFARSEPPASA